MKKTLLLPVLTCLLSTVCAQTAPPEKEPQRVVGLHMQYGFYLPAGDLADRFGRDNSVQLSLDLLGKNDWLFGAEGQYFFGQKAKEDPLAKLRTPEGIIIGNNLLPASIFLKERGAFVGGYVGRVFQFNKAAGREDRVNGLRVTLGAGWLQHKIRIQDDETSVAQVAGDYIKGYDRLTGGPAATQFVGYQLYTKKRRINFHAGLSVQEGFTKSLRSYNFDEMRADTGRRLDVRVGLVAGWTLPFYLGDRGEDIYY